MTVDGLASRREAKSSLPPTTSARPDPEHAPAYHAGLRIALPVPVVAEAKLDADIVSFVQSAAGRSSLIRDGVYRVGWIIEGSMDELAGLVTEIVGESLSRMWLGSDRKIYRSRMTGDGSDPTSAHARSIYALFARVGFIPKP